MAKTRITLTIDDDVFRAVKIKTARTGKCDSQIVEESLRRDLGLDDLDDIWAQVKPAPEEEGLHLAYSELHAMRREEKKLETDRP
jgi:gamma-glutamyl:cysteine ligase YbdK (ATP-grasp superfamily)